MKNLRKILLSLLVFQIAFCNLQFAFPQNLVPNPSFEEHDSCGIAGACPTGFSMICIATGWIAAKGSPDYFNACDSNMASIFGPDTGMVAVPKNIFGNQNAATGDAYAGLYTYLGYNYNPNNHNEREWLICPLINPLTIGKKYSISFKASLADSVNCASNNLGVLFSTVSIYYPVYTPLNNYAHFNNTMIIEDTTNWTNVQGSFISDSAYRYMMIGNFYDFSFTDSIFYPSRPVMSFIDSSICWAYYYIDDISVVVDSTNGILDDNLKFKVNIYPNPTSGTIMIDFTDSQKLTIRIFNLLGQLLFEDSFYEKNINIDLSSYPDGMYLIQAQQDNKFFNKKIALIK